MQVEMTVTFTTEEILGMCREKVAKIEMAVPGEFELRAEGLYGPKVVARFVPAQEVEN